MIKRAPTPLSRRTVLRTSFSTLPSPSSVFGRRVHQSSPRLTVRDHATKAVATPSRDAARDKEAPTPTTIPVPTSSDTATIVAPQGLSRGYLPGGKEQLPPEHYQYVTLLPGATTATALQTLYTAKKKGTAQPAAFHAAATLRRLVPICTPPHARHPEPVTGDAARLAHQLLADVTAASSSLSFRDISDVLNAAMMLRVTLSRPLVRQLADQALKRLQQRPAAADMRHAYGVLSSLAGLKYQPPVAWLHAWCQATEQEVAVMSLTSMRFTLDALASMWAVPPTSYMQAMLRALQSAEGDAVTAATACNQAMWRDLQRLCGRPLKHWRVQLPIVAAIWNLDRESPEETTLLDALDGAKTWREVRDAMRVAPPAGAGTLCVVGAAVARTCQLLHQQDHEALGSVYAASQQGRDAKVAGGAPGEAGDEDSEGDNAPTRAAEEQQWMYELAAMWSEELVGELQGKEAANFLASMMLTRSHVQADVVQRLLRRFAVDNAALHHHAKVSAKLVWAARVAGVRLPEEDLAMLLQHVGAGFEQLRTVQLLRLSRGLQEVAVQQVPDSLLDALVGHCQHLQLESISQRRLHLRLELVEAVRMLSPNASAALAQKVWQARKALDEGAERDARARLQEASSWQEVRHSISCYADGSYSRLPLSLLLATYTALARCLLPQCSYSYANDQEGLQTDQEENGLRERLLATCLADLALRYRVVQPALVHVHVDLPARLLGALQVMPAAYRTELAPVAELTIQLMADKMGLQHVGKPSAVLSSTLRLLVRLRLEVPGTTQKQLRAQALRAVGEYGMVQLYWVVRAMNEGRIGAADSDAVKTVLRRMHHLRTGDPIPLIQQLQKVALDNTRWLQKYPAARAIWDDQGAPIEQQLQRPWSSLVAQAPSWQAIRALMEEAARKGQPWRGLTCCIALERLSHWAGSKQSNSARGMEPGVADLALRVLQQLSRDSNGCAPAQLPAAVRAVGLLGLQPAEGVLAALLDAGTSRVTTWHGAVQLLEGLGRMRYFPGSHHMAALLAVMQPSLHRMEASSVVTALLSCSSLRYCPPSAFMADALRQVQAKAGGLSPSSRRHLLSALENLEHQPDEAVMAALLMPLPAQQVSHMNSVSSV